MLRNISSEIRGVIVPLITPYYNGSFDEKSFVQLANNAIKAGVDGIFILGNMGEFKFLPIEVKKRIIDLSVKKFDKTPIIAGVTCKDLENTLSLTKYSQEKGIDAVVLVPLYQTKFPPAEYIKKVAYNKNIPILIYENPGITDNRILSNNEIMALSQLSNVVGMKLTYPKFEDFKRVRKLKLPSFKLFQGHEDFLRQSFGLGIDGIIAGTANIYPELMVRIYKEKREEDFRKLNEITRECKDISKTKQIAKIKELISSSELVPHNKIY